MKKTAFPADQKPRFPDRSLPIPFSEKPGPAQRRPVPSQGRSVMTSSSDPGDFGIEYERNRRRGRLRLSFPGNDRVEADRARGRESAEKRLRRLGCAQRHPLSPWATISARGRSLSMGRRSRARRSTDSACSPVPSPRLEKTNKSKHPGAALRKPILDAAELGHRRSILARVRHGH